MRIVSIRASDGIWCRSHQSSSWKTSTVDSWWEHQIEPSIWSCSRQNSSWKTSTVDSWREQRTGRADLGTNVSGELCTLVLNLLDFVTVVPRKGVTHLGRSILPVLRKEVFKDLNLLDFVMTVPRKGSHLGRSTLPVSQFDKLAKTTRKCLTLCSLVETWYRCSMSIISRKSSARLTTGKKNNSKIPAVATADACEETDEQLRYCT